VSAARVDAEVVRLAVMREWVLAEDAPEPKKKPAEPERVATPVEGLPADAASFAKRVLKVARALPTGRFGDDKVFISHVWKALQPEWTSREAFDTALLEANRKRHLSLTRADLVSVMNPADVAESEVRFYGATFHFVVV
ncbi:MAG: hypothetical protein EOO70_03205, partial [Myxococcaceae bacterium]